MLIHKKKYHFQSINTQKPLRPLLKGTGMIDQPIIYYIFEQFPINQRHSLIVIITSKKTMDLDLVNDIDSISKITIDESLEIEKIYEQPGRLSSGKQRLWTYEEQSIYLQYLKDNLKSLSSPKLRKKLRIFKKISTLLGTRTPIQVKSHHQKLENKYHVTSKVIVHLERQLSRYRHPQEMLNAEQIMEVPSTSQQFCLVQQPQVTIDFHEEYLHGCFDFEEDDLFFS